MEKISVIVPIYNSSKYIRKCIDSIIGQTYRNLEIILVNDGSTDDSGTICDEYAERDERIIVIHQQNAGESMADNKGLDVSTGKYIGFVDADDWIAEDMYELLYRSMIEYDADISICGHYEEDAEHGIYEIKESSGDVTVFNSREAIGKVVEDKEIHSFVWDKLYRRRLFEGFRFRQGVILEDIATMYRIFMRANKIVLYDLPKYYYYQRQDSALHTRNEKLNWDQFCVYRERLLVLEKDYPEFREILLTSLVAFGIAAYNCLLLKEQISPEEERQKEEMLDVIKKYGKEIRKEKYGEKGLRCRIGLVTLGGYDKIYSKLKRKWNSINTKT